MPRKLWKKLALLPSSFKSGRAEIYSTARVLLGTGGFYIHHIFTFFKIRPWKTKAALQLFELIGSNRSVDRKAE